MFSNPASFRGTEAQERLSQGHTANVSHNECVANCRAHSDRLAEESASEHPPHTLSKETHRTRRQEFNIFRKHLGTHENSHVAMWTAVECSGLFTGFTKVSLRAGSVCQAGVGAGHRVGEKMHPVPGLQLRGQHRSR